MEDGKKHSRLTLQQVLDAVMDESDDENPQEDSSDDDSVVGDYQDEDGNPANFHMSTVQPKFVPDPCDKDSVFVTYVSNCYPDLYKSTV